MRRNIRNLLLTTTLVLAIVGSISVRREYHDHAGEVAHTHHAHTHRFAEQPSERAENQSEETRGNRSWLRRPRLGEQTSSDHSGYSHSEHAHTHSGHPHLNGSEHGVGGHSHISFLGWEFTVWDPKSFFYSAELLLHSNQAGESLRASRRELRTELFVGSPSLDFREGESGDWLMNPTLRRTRCPRADDSRGTWLKNANDRESFLGRKPPLPPPRCAG